MKKVRPIKSISGTPFSRLVAEYVNARFKGNLTLAAREIDCNYDQLWNAATGARKKPNLELAAALAVHSGRALEWWIAGGRGGPEPAVGAWRCRRERRHV